MATGLGPSSSGSQATVASVVTSTFLAGLGVSGGVISSLPSSVWPTQVPQVTQSPRHSSTPAAKPSTEQVVPQAAETDSAAEENQAAPKGEEEEEDDEGDGEGEQEDRDAEKKKKNKTTPTYAETRDNSTVVKESVLPTPASTAKEKATVQGSTVSASTVDGHLTPPQENLTDVNAVTTQEPRNDSAEMQIPQSSTLSPKISSDGKSLWPFSIHTGEANFSHVKQNFA